MLVWLYMVTADRCFIVINLKSAYLHKKLWNYQLTMIGLLFVQNRVYVEICKIIAIVLMIIQERVEEKRATTY